MAREQTDRAPQAKLLGTSAEFARFYRMKSNQVVWLSQEITCTKTTQAQWASCAYCVMKLKNFYEIYNL